MYNYGNIKPGDPKFQIGDTVFYVVDMTKDGSQMIHKGEIFCVHARKDFKGGINYEYSIKSVANVVVLNEEHLHVTFFQALEEVKKDQGEINECGA